MQPQALRALQALQSHAGPRLRWAGLPPRLHLLPPRPLQLRHSSFTCSTKLRRLDQLHKGSLRHPCSVPVQQHAVFQLIALPLRRIHGRFTSCEARNSRPLPPLLSSETLCTVRQTRSLQSLTLCECSWPSTSVPSCFSLPLVFHDLPTQCKLSPTSNADHLGKWIPVSAGDVSPRHPGCRSINPPVFLRWTITSMGTVIWSHGAKDHGHGYQQI